MYRRLPQPADPPRRNANPEAETGFTLIEVVLVIVIIGILATVALQSGRQVYDTARVEQTRQELDDLATAIAGNPSLQNNGVRIDFGYVGDIGALPPNLDALRTNPGGYVTWNGPYVKNRFTQTPDDYKMDAWGAEYVFVGISLTSVGSGSDITRRIAGSVDELLYNRVSGNVFDLDGSPPGPDYWDSLTVRLTVPDGSGSTVARGAVVGSGGFFFFDSVPVGNHDLMICYEPDHDTVTRLVSVQPGSSHYGEYRLPGNVWYAAGDIPGLIGHYPLDEGLGQTTSDYSGWALPASLQNDPAGSGWTSGGQLSGAFDFDGADDFFETATSVTELQITGDYSIAVWIYAKPTQVALAAICCRCTPTGSDNQWSLQFDNQPGSSKQLSVYHPGGQNWQSTWTLADAQNAWHHVTVTYRQAPARIQLFVNGTLHSESTILTQSPGSGNGKFRIGCDRTTNTWNGMIDDLRIYNRVLQPTEIQNLYFMGS